MVRTGDNCPQGSSSPLEREFELTVIYILQNNTKPKYSLTVIYKYSILKSSVPTDETVRTTSTCKLDGFI